MRVKLAYFFWLSRDPIAEDGGLNLYGYVGNDPINSWAPLGLKDFSEGETRGVLDQVKQASSKSLIPGAVELHKNHTANGRFDFKMRNRGDTFMVNGQRMSADHFGNFAAGYAGMTYDELVGYGGMRAAGIVYDMADGGPTYFDDDGSAELIDAGADLAQCESNKKYNTSFFRKLDSIFSGFHRIITFRWLH